MSKAQDTLNSLVSITQFNKGQASRIFDRLRSEKQLIVLKNNVPSAVILSPEEYIRLSELAEDYALMLEAQKRLSHEGRTLSLDEVMNECGVTQEDIDNAQELEIERAGR
mgnify:CR=1 FL=1